MSSKLIVNSIENTTGTHTINLDSGNSSIVGDLTVGGDLTATGVTMTGDFLPSTDNTSDLGSTAKRFQNLHLSGGVSFDEDPSLVAGSVSSKTLDDYEEGTFNATIATSGSGTISISPSYDAMRYTKVGNIVHIQGEVRVAAVSSPSGTEVRINGLPFVVGNLLDFSGRAHSACFHYSASTTSVAPNATRTISGESRIRVTTDASQVIAGEEFGFSFTYTVA